MKKYLVGLLICTLMPIYSVCSAENKNLGKVAVVKPTGYTVELTVKDIPKGQQTLFIPIKLDNSIVDVDMVSVNDLAASNILAVSSDSKGMSGAGIGLIKFDNDGLPTTLMLNVSLSAVSSGTSEIGVYMLLDEQPALAAKGLTINNGVKANLKDVVPLEVVEILDKGKKRLKINHNKITIDVHRENQKEETIFIPIVFDSTVDLDESFGHAILGQGIAAKTYSASSLNNEGGPGVELVLSPSAVKDFTVDVDLVPKGVGKAKLFLSVPQNSKTAIVKGPIVEFSPAVVSVNK